MNNNITLVAAVTITAVVTDRINRIKFNRKNHNLAPHNKALAEITELLMKQNKELAEQLAYRIKVNGFLVHQNEYLVGMLDTHNVPVTEFDRIAMGYPIDTEK